MSQNIDRLRDWQRDCLVQVTGGNKVGSGFFIAPGVVLTCGHVAGEKTGVTLQAIWNGRAYAAKVTVSCPAPRYAELWHLPDLAVLTLVDAPENHPALWLDDRQPETGARLGVAGFSDVYSPRTRRSTVHLAVPSDRSGMVDFLGHERLYGDEALRVGNDELAEGMSGGPVLNPATGGVCGVIKTARRIGTDQGGLVIPTRGLRDLDPELYRRIRREHDKYHGVKRRGHVDVAMTFSRQNLSPGEERRIRAVLATMAYREDLVADRRNASNRNWNKARDYGDVVIDLDEGQTGTDPIPRAIAYVAELVHELPESRPLRDRLMGVAGRMGIGQEVEELLEQLPKTAPLPDPPPPDPPPPDPRPPDPQPPDPRWRLLLRRRHFPTSQFDQWLVGWRRTTFVVFLVAVLVATHWIMWLASEETPALCEHPAEVRVLTSAEQLEPYKAVAGQFEDWIATQHDGCRAVNVYVYAAPPDKAREALIHDWTDDPDDSGETQYLRDVGPQADVWLPGSQLELSAVEAELPEVADRTPIGSTPLVLGVPASRPGVVDTEAADWLSSLGTAMTNGLDVIRPDPAASVVGELATVGLYSKPDPEARSPGEIERWLERSLDAGKYTIGDVDGLLCRQRQLAASERPAAVITSEQALVRYNGGGPLGSRCAGGQVPDRLVAAYPADTLSVDLYFVPLVRDGAEQGQATRGAVAALEGWLTSAEGRKAIESVGVRPTGVGTDLAAPFDDEHGVDKRWPFGHSVAEDPAAEDRTKALATYAEARRPGRVLLAVDASGSMDEPADAQGTTRFGVALRGVAASLTQMNENRDELGLWLFSTKAGRSGVAQVLPIGKNAAQARELTSNGQQWQPGGNTPLYRTMTAGVRTIGAYEDRAVSALVVLTDGFDTATEDWLDDLGREIAANPEVRIFLIAVGEATCDTPVFVKLANDTAGQCLPATTGTVDDSLTTLFRILWTKG